MQIEHIPLKYQTKRGENYLENDLYVPSGPTICQGNKPGQVWGGLSSLCSKQRKGQRTSAGSMSRTAQITLACVEKAKEVLSKHCGKAAARMSRMWASGSSQRGTAAPLVVWSRRFGTGDLNPLWRGHQTGHQTTFSLSG